ncbi:hypothetical protein KL938_004417 [Ogataea parapolymorpha]|nr:hypothetical protein KL938_004417 [Ogataea parapolymorpha]
MGTMSLFLASSESSRTSQLWIAERRRIRSEENFPTAEKFPTPDQRTALAAEEVHNLAWKVSSHHRDKDGLSNLRPLRPPPPLNPRLFGRAGSHPPSPMEDRTQIYKVSTKFHLRHVADLSNNCAQSSQASLSLVGGEKLIFSDFDDSPVYAPMRPTERTEAKRRRSTTPTKPGEFAVMS